MKVQDIHSTDMGLWAQYIIYFTDGRYNAAASLLENAQLDTKKAVAEMFNNAADSIDELQQLYYDGVEGDLATKLATFNQLIANLVNKQEYAASAEYSMGNFVVYNNQVYVYINATPSTGNLPTNTIYWLYLGLQGKQGADGISVNLKYAWASDAQYNANDAVVYKNVLYYAKRANSNKAPDTNTADWGVIFQVPKAVIYTGATAPSNPYEGLIWVKFI